MSRCHDHLAGCRKLRKNVDDMGQHDWKRRNGVVSGAVLSAEVKKR